MLRVKLKYAKKTHFASLKYSYFLTRGHGVLGPWRVGGGL